MRKETGVEQSYQVQPTEFSLLTGFAYDSGSPQSLEFARFAVHPYATNAADTMLAESASMPAPCGIGWFQKLIGS